MKINGKKRRRIVLILAIIFLMLTGGYAAYANKGTLLNSYYLLTKSPSEYYTYIEQYGLYRHFQSYPMGTDKKEDPYAYHISSTMKFHQKELDAILDTLLDANLTDLENTLGIPLDQVSFDMLLASDHYRLNNTVEVRLNDTILFTPQFFLDRTDRNLSFKVPELSEAYLSYSLDDNNEQYTTKEQPVLLHKERMERIVHRYSELYFNHLSTVTLEKKMPLSLDEIETECNLLTVTFTQEESKKLLLALLETSKSDEDILALLPSFRITKEQYFHAIEYLERLVHEKFKNVPQDANFMLKLYLDRKGHVLSRELSCFEQISLGYTFLENKDLQEYVVHLSHTSSESKLRIIGTNRKINGTNGGNLTLRLHVPSLTTSPDLNLDVIYEGLKSVIKDDKRYLEGSFILSSENLAGVQITSVFDYTEDKQLNTTAFRLGTSPFITISSIGGALIEYGVPLRDLSGTSYDSSRYEEYWDNINFESYLDKITASLGIDPAVRKDFLMYGPSR